MRRLMMIVAAGVGLAVAAVAVPTSAEARFDSGLTVPDATTAQPVQYYYGYRRPYYRPRYYAPRYYAPRYYAPRYYAPRYRYRYY
ncbi:MAG: hypothetical protein AB7V13_20405 [Pseudorhodoplanes sp.]|uniref:hypothetical protein n=1 Tax=Pseudorhodoplanes sp. TaxID=1934341 RepID=UPI003D0BDA6A